MTSTRLKLFLEDNLLTTLREDVFRPLMDRMLDGWGELDVEGKDKHSFEKCNECCQLGLHYVIYIYIHKVY